MGDRNTHGRQGRSKRNSARINVSYVSAARWMAVPIFNIPLIQEHQCCNGDLFWSVPRCVLKSSYNRCTWLMSSSKCRPPAVPLYRLNNTCGCFNALVFPPSPQKVAVLQRTSCGNEHNKLLSPGQKFDWVRAGKKLGTYRIWAKGNLRVLTSWSPCWLLNRSGMFRYVLVGYILTLKRRTGKHIL